MRHNTKAIFASGTKHVFLFFHALLCLVPFIWVIISSFKDNTGIFTDPFGLPEKISFHNYVIAWSNARIGEYLLNSLIISIVTVIILTLFVAMAAYVLTRLVNAPMIIGYLMLGLMIPIHAMLIPDFLIISRAGMMNNKLSLILIYIAVNISFGYFLMAGYMESIPKELDEAAMIDGAGYVRTFFRIILPVSKPALATVGTFTFLNSWNEFLFAFVINTKTEYMTIAQGINNLRGQYSTDYGLLCAGLLFGIVPVIIMYVFLQKYVMSGMTAGAVKG